MKKLLVLIFAMTSLLAGCYVYDNPYRDGASNRGHDRDRDGVRDRDDRRPNNPSRN